MFNREPALWLGLLAALIALAVGFGLNLTTGQVGLIMAAATAILSVITRQLVTPVANAGTDPNDPRIGKG